MKTRRRRQPLVSFKLRITLDNARALREIIQHYRDKPEPPIWGGQIIAAKTVAALDRTIGRAQAVTAEKQAAIPESIDFV